MSNAISLSGRTRKNSPWPTASAPRSKFHPGKVVHHETERHREHSLGILCFKLSVPHQYRQKSTNRPIEMPRAEMQRLRTLLASYCLTVSKVSEQIDHRGKRCTDVPLCPDIRLPWHHRQETSVAAPELPLVRRDIELVKNRL